MDSRRQHRVARLLQKEFSQILHTEGSRTYGEALVTVTGAEVSPDLSVAKFYLSIFNTSSPENVIRSLNGAKKELRKKLGEKVRFQVRRIPELIFLQDETAGKAFRIEEIFRKIKKEGKED